MSGPKEFECELSGCPNTQKKNATIAFTIPGVEGITHLQVCGYHYYIVSVSRPGMYSIGEDLALKPIPAVSKEKA